MRARVRVCVCARARTRERVYTIYAYCNVINIMSYKNDFVLRNVLTSASRKPQKRRLRSLNVLK